MAENMFDIIGDMETIGGEVEAISQCLKCCEILSYILQQHSKYHQAEEFSKCLSCQEKIFKLGILHLSYHKNLIRLLKSDNILKSDDIDPGYTTKIIISDDIEQVDKNKGDDDMVKVKDDMIIVDDDMIKVDVIKVDQDVIDNGDKIQDYSDEIKDDSHKFVDIKTEYDNKEIELIYDEFQNIYEDNYNMRNYHTESENKFEESEHNFNIDKVDNTNNSDFNYKGNYETVLNLKVEDANEAHSNDLDKNKLIKTYDLQLKIENDTDIYKIRGVKTHEYFKVDINDGEGSIINDIKDERCTNSIDNSDYKIYNKNLSNNSIDKENVEEIHNCNVIYNCEVCSLTFMSKEELKVHISEPLSKEDMSMCNDLIYSFNENKYNCEVCGLTFLSKAHLQVHINEPVFEEELSTYNDLIYSFNENTYDEIIEPQIIKYLIEHGLNPFQSLTEDSVEYDDSLICGDSSIIDLNSLLNFKSITEHSSIKEELDQINENTSHKNGQNFKEKSFNESSDELFKENNRDDNTKPHNESFLYSCNQCNYKVLHESNILSHDVQMRKDMETDNVKFKPYKSTFSFLSKPTDFFRMDDKFRSNNDFIRIDKFIKNFKFKIKRNVKIRVEFKFGRKVKFKFGRKVKFKFGRKVKFKFGRNVKFKSRILRKLIEKAMQCSKSD